MYSLSDNGCTIHRRKPFEVFSSKMKSLLFLQLTSVVTSLTLGVIEVTKMH